MGNIATHEIYIYAYDAMARRVHTKVGSQERYSSLIGGRHDWRADLIMGRCSFQEREYSEQTEVMMNSRSSSRKRIGLPMVPAVLPILQPASGLAQSACSTTVGLAYPTPRKDA